MQATEAFTSTEPPLSFDNSYAHELEGFYLPWQAAKAPAPRLIQFNFALAAELGPAFAALDDAQAAEIFSGNLVPPGANPIVLAYAGHQFGGFSPQLGDGRALLLGEVIDLAGQRRDIALKGSGRTPFSRNGDGKAALGPVLREYLVSEAMHALAIPTTRALAVVATGETVYRETRLPAAVLTRVAASHIRIGTFQFFATRGEYGMVKRLADYVIARHYPETVREDTPYLGLLKAVCQRQALLVAKWMNIGFIHGVMNTDNMTLSGETLDYGPCAFLEHYDPAACFSSIDRQGRYAYANQPSILGWNLARLAETLLPLLDADATKAAEMANEVLSGVQTQYEHERLNGMRAKLGLAIADSRDRALAQDFLDILRANAADYTLAFRYLASAPNKLRVLCGKSPAFDAWLQRWQDRLQLEVVSVTFREATMRQANPAFIPRNHRVEEAISAAVEADDFGPFQTMLAVLAHPFEDQPDHPALEQPASRQVTDAYLTFCGT